MTINVFTKDKFEITADSTQMFVAKKSDDTHFYVSVSGVSYEISKEEYGRVFSLLFNNIKK